VSPLFKALKRVAILDLLIYSHCASFGKKRHDFHLFNIFFSLGNNAGVNLLLG